MARPDYEAIKELVPAFCWKNTGRRGKLYFESVVKESLRNHFPVKNASYSFTGPNNWTETSFTWLFFHA
jgi:hypothetical protein